MKYSLFLLPIVILILSGCTKETVLSRSGDEGCLISFEFSIPTPAEHSRATAKLSNESAISDIYVFAFESGSDKLKDWAEAEVVSASGSVTTGTMKLSTAANGSGTHKLVFLANVKSEILAALGAGTIVADMDYASFQPVLTTDIGSILTADPTSGFRFPMWGETDYLSLTSTTELTGTKAVAVQRALAKIDVAVNRQTDGTTPGLPDFKLTGVMVYNINFNAVVIPDPDHVGNDRIVTAPTIATPTELKNVIRNATEASGCLSSIYVPETLNSNSTPLPPYLIVKGIYLGKDPQNTEESFYRIDIVSGQPDNQRHHLLRNHSYTFNIKQVYQEGYPTLEEAADGAGMTYDLFTVSDYNNANDLYSVFSYNNLGYIALKNDSQYFTYPQGSEKAFTVKAQFKEDMDPVIDGYFCTEAGEKIISQNFEATIDHTMENTVTLKTISDNTSEESIVQYYKVFVVEDPDISLIVKLEQYPFTFSNAMGGIRSDDKNYTLVAGNASQYYVWFYGPIPASKFRISREGGYTVEANHPFVMQGQSLSDGFSLPVNDTPHYLELKVEWLHPWTGEWLLYKDTEQVGVNYRIDVSGAQVYVARNDAPRLSGTANYTGMSWSEALGISDIYNTTQFSTSPEYNGGKYTPTDTSTGCGAYYEGSVSDPITGRGKWRAPTGPEYTSGVRMYLYNTDGYFGIPSGILDRSGSYITSTDNTATNYNSYTVMSPTATSRAKTTAINYRIRCVRDAQ